MIEFIAIISLSLLCLGQTIERYFYQKDMSNKLNDAIKAVLSRNINEYIAATTKPSNNTASVENDQIDFNADNPDAFDLAIDKLNNKG